MKSLVIVESPAKAKTINKILGRDYSVKASIGHVRDLPGNELGVDVNNDFAPKYHVIYGKEKIVKELKKAAKDAEVVYLAPDPDREGEAIAWHIAEELKSGKNKGVTKEDYRKIYRITFNEITEKAVLEAIGNPGRIDMNKVYAQQARRILDRLVGYGLSPLLWRKVKRGLSAGRVQSVAVRLVVEREREIEGFKPVEYWSITGLFGGPKPPEFNARLFKYNGKYIINREKNEFYLKDEDSARTLVEELRGKEYVLKKIEKKLRRRNPSPPFITSSLQQEASRRLGFTPKKTMTIAQQLYEGIELGKEGSVGLITYMRTDSVRIAEEAREAAWVFIKERYGKEYLPQRERPKGKNKQSKAKYAQDAHEGIRPTYIDKPLEAIKGFLTRDQYALYRLIWQRLIASQMSTAKIEQTTVTITDRDEKAEFRVVGNVMKFEGFMVVYTESGASKKREILWGESSGENVEKERETEDILPSLKEGEPFSLKEIDALQYFTQPPPRYTEASLVRTLEEKGIGRPSTYAAILLTIQDRKYVKKEEGKIKPTELGVVVNDLLVERFPELMDVSFTAKMEDELDSVEDGRLRWVNAVEEIYKPFSKDMTEAMNTLGKIRPPDEPTDIVCEICGQPMVKRWGRHGRFIACTSFPKCKNTKPLKDSNGEKKAQEESNIKCPECGTTMVIKQSRYGRFLACSRYPECKGIMPVSTGVKCPLDGGEIVERKSKKGKTFWSCSNWPVCKFATWYRPVSEKCPECGSYYLVEKKDRTGKIIICPNRDCQYKKVPEEREGIISK